MSKINNNTDFFAYVDNFGRYRHIRSIRMYGEHKILAPKVSITIPTYRRPELLRETVESAVNQVEYSNYEIIIVDNDSVGEYTDQIIEMLRSITSDKIIYYRNQENIGMFGNWNRCIELAGGEFITIINDDDLLEPSALKSFSKYYDDYSFIKGRFLSSRVIKTRERWLHLISRRRLFLYNSIIRLNYAGSCGIMFKKVCAMEVGGFDENKYYFADWQFFLKYIKKYQGVEIKEIVAWYRIDGQNTCTSSEFIKKTVPQCTEFIRNVCLSELGFPTLIKSILSYILITDFTLQYGDGRQSLYQKFIRVVRFCLRII